MPGARTVAVVASLLAVATAHGDGDDRRNQRLETVTAAAEIVREKVIERRADFRRSLSRVYRLLRPRRNRIPGRADTVRARTWRRAWLRKVVGIKKTELDALEAELEFIERSRQFESGASHQGSVGRLSAPVDGEVARDFGSYRHASGARLMRRGIELSTDSGEEVRAPQGGIVDYVGELRGLGPAILLSCARGPRVILGGVEARVAIGDRVEEGQVLGTAMGSRLYMELRVGAGAGDPVDPRPFLKVESN